MLDDHLPSYDVSDRHEVRLSAAPEAAVRDARLLTPREVPVFAVLMALRGLPAFLSGKPRPGLGQPILDGMRRWGFVWLEEAPTEIVLGAVGAFWKPSGGLRRVSAPEFRAFAEPGYAKGAMNFRAERRAGKTVLSTETRVATTDDASRRAFARYWTLIKPGSAAIRWDWLRAARRRSSARPAP